MPTTLYVQLTTPPVAGQIVDGDGAITPREQAATVALFRAITEQDVNAVQRALAQGARPNARRPPPRMGQKPLEYLATPLDIALWLITRDEEDAIRPPPNRASQPVPDLCATLIAAGATTHNPPAVFFQNSGWEPHPACKALEHHFLDLLVNGARRPMMTREARDNPVNGKAEYLTQFRSVVVATPVRRPHSWLHRAIVRERWDAVRTWMDLDLVMNFPGSEAAGELLVMGWFDEPDARAAQTLAQGLDLLRPGLLRETDTAYRTEVVGLVRALAFFDGAVDEDRRAHLVQWLGQVLRERPTPLTLSEAEIASAAEDGPAMRRIMQAYETDALQRTLAGNAWSERNPRPRL